MKRAFFGVALGVASLALAGCAGQSSAPSGAWQPAVPTAAHPQLPPALARDATFSVSGTYDGTVHVSENGKSGSGSLVFALTQKGSDISGSFDISHGGKIDDLSVKGTVRIEGKKKAALAFKIYDPKGQYATATATVKGKKLTGTGTAGKADISFKAKKTKKL